MKSLHNMLTESDTIDSYTTLLLALYMLSCWSELVKEVSTDL